jgi:hypothetical protein
MVRPKIIVFVVWLLAVASQPNDAQKKKGLNMIDKEKLAERIESVSDGLAPIVRLEETKIEQTETPFFKRGEIYTVIYLGGSHPIVFTVGTAQENFTVMLPLNPKGFMELKEKAGLRRFESNKEALQYVMTFLKTTRSFSENFLIIEKFDDIDSIPQPSDEEKQKQETLKNKFATVIEPPKISGSSPWKAVVYVIKRRSLVKINAELSPNGNIETTETVLEEVLPIPYTR